jgi:hypothetical protein
MIIKNNDMRLIIIGDIKLLPGFNDVDTELFKDYTEGKGKGKSKTPKYDLKETFDNKILEKVIETKDENEVIEFIDFSMSLKEKIVNETYSIKVLDTWRKTEQNISVKVLIEDRLKALKENKINDISTYGKPANHT